MLKKENQETLARNKNIGQGATSPEVLNKRLNSLLKNTGAANIELRSSSLKYPRWEAIRVIPTSFIQIAK
jgi:hypothetical protein